jgi:hypothetical protein
VILRGFARVFITLMSSEKPAIFVVTDPRIDNQGTLNYYGMLEGLGGTAGGENLSSRTSGEEWPSTTLARAQSTGMA